MDREQLRMDYYRQLNQLTLPMAYDRLREGKVRMGEKEWQTIYANTDACFPGFTGRLRTTFPFLKEDDIRLCCLVKMEMPLDLTALIFGIGKGSVTQRKQQLRQKMELEGSLDEYLGVRLGVEVLDHFRLGAAYDYGVRVITCYYSEMHNGNLTLFVGYTF